MIKIRALIVDDEYPAREELRYCLNKLHHINIVGEATNAEEALTLINALNYDVVFLDISFPNSNGIDVGKEIANMENPPKIIYVTAYEEYAYKAFEVNAIDYILKPIEESKLAKAISKISINNDDLSDQSIEKSNIPPDNMIRLSAEKNGKIIILSTDDIYYFYTEQSYVYVKTANDQYITRYTLSSLEKKLDSKTFFRTHRSFIVNLSKIKEVLPFFKGTYNLVLTDKSQSKIQVSRRQAKELRKILDI